MQQNLRHNIWGDMMHYRPPVRHLGGRVPLSPAGFTPLCRQLHVPTRLRTTKRLLINNYRLINYRTMLTLLINNHKLRNGLYYLSLDNDSVFIMNGE